MDDVVLSNVNHMISISMKNIFHDHDDIHTNDNIDVSRRTEKINYKYDADNNMDDNISYSINSFTNHRIRQTIDHTDNANIMRDIDNDSKGVKLATHDVWTKDKVKNMLSNSKNNTIPFVIGNPNITHNKSKDSTQNRDRKKNSIDSIDKKIHKVHIDISNNGNSKIHSNITFKQKDFISYGNNIDVRKTAEFRNNLVESSIEKKKNIDSIGYKDIHMSKKKSNHIPTVSNRSIKSYSHDVGPSQPMQNHIDSMKVKVDDVKKNRKMNIKIDGDSSVNKKADRQESNNNSVHSSATIDRLYQHAFDKKYIQQSIRQQLDKQKMIDDMKECTFKPTINNRSRNMNISNEYTYSSHKLYKRPTSSYSNNTDRISIQSEKSIKYNILNNINHHDVYQPIILSIQKTDILNEINHISTYTPNRIENHHNAHTDNKKKKQPVMVKSIMKK